MVHSTTDRTNSSKYREEHKDSYRENRRRSISPSGRKPTSDSPRRRSRSPTLGSKVSRERDRERERDRGRTRTKVQETEKLDILDDQKDEQRGDSAELDMAAVMGFASFGTTKQKKVGPDVGGSSVKESSKFRQYMNRTRGFNRNLSP